MNLMTPALERLRPWVITILGFVTLVLLLRAVLGVNTTHEKLDEILKQLREMKSHRPGESNPPTCAGNTEDTNGEHK